MDPGPVSNDVLYLHGTHQSAQIDSSEGSLYEC